MRGQGAFDTGDFEVRAMISLLFNAPVLPLIQSTRPLSILQLQLLYPLLQFSKLILQVLYIVLKIIYRP